MRKVISAAVVLLSAVFLVWPGSNVAQPPLPYPDIPRTTKEELKDMLGKTDVVIMDVRLPQQWDLSDEKIPGAVHENEAETAKWAGKYDKDKAMVAYCA